MFSPIKSYRTLSRYRTIVLTVSRYGFGELFGRLRIRSFRRKNVTAEKVMSRGKRFRLLLEELGPTFIKFGQLLSTRSDLLPADIVEELIELQDRVSPWDWEKIKPRFDQAGIDIEKNFKQFDTVPIASASLAQVYSAMPNTGEHMAVKVLRPNIEETINADMEILGQFAAIFSKHFEEARRWEPEGLIREFRRSISRELDLRHEGRNADIFRMNFANDPTVYVPKIYWDMSSRQILVMEFIKGRKISEFFDPKIDIQIRKIIAANGARAVLKQIFQHGFFQADPHPGNTFVMENNVICFLDFGMFGRLDNETLQHLAQGLYALVGKDATKLIKAGRALGIITDETNLKELKLSVIDMVEQYHGIPLKQLHLGRLLAEIVQLVRMHKLKLRSDFMMLIKALTTIESIGRELDPEFDIIEHAKPFVGNIIAKQYSGARILKEARVLSEDFGELVKSAPEETLEILRKIRAGQLKIDFEHKGLEEPINELNRMTDKLMLGLVTAGLLVASSLMAQIGKGPTFLGYPIVGIFGFFAAGLMVLWIFWDIIRRK